MADVPDLDAVSFTLTLRSVRHANRRSGVDKTHRRHGTKTDGQQTPQWPARSSDAQDTLFNPSHRNPAETGPSCGREAKK
jgi:hypothetical protein